MIRKSAGSQGHGRRPTMNGVAQLHADNGHWIAPAAHLIHHMHARNFCLDPIASPVLPTPPTKPPTSLRGMRPLKLINRPKNVLSSTFWQVAIGKVPRTYPAELYSTGTRIAKAQSRSIALVLRPRSRPPGQIPGVCLATSLL